MGVNAADCVFIESMRSRRTGRIRAGLSPALGLLLLSALWAISSLRTELFPPWRGYPVARVAPGSALLRLRRCGCVHRRGAPRRIPTRAPRVGLCLHRPRPLRGSGRFGGLHTGLVSALDRVAVFSLTPVFAVVLEPYLQGTVLRQEKAALSGALTAVAGILCLFPLDIPVSFRAGAALCALLAAAVSIAATNCFAVSLARNLAGHSTLPMAALAGAASAVCFSVAAAFTPHTAWRWTALPPQLLWLLAIDFPALFLLSWLMRRLAASRMTARYFLAPLFTILAGIALEPASPPVRAWLGMALLAGGAGWLVFAPAEKTEIEELTLLSAFPAESPRRPPSDK